MHCTSTTSKSSKPIHHPDCHVLDAAALGTMLVKRYRPSVSFGNVKINAPYHLVHVIILTACVVELEHVFGPGSNAVPTVVMPKICHLTQNHSWLRVAPIAIATHHPTVHTTVALFTSHGR